MSITKIKNFNYFAVGDKSKMFSFDLQDLSGNVSKNMVLFGSVERNNNDMTPAEKYNKFSFKFVNDPNIIVHPLYDIKDVCIRTTLKKQSSDEHLDIFASSVRKNPIQFTQFDDVAYVLNDTDTKSFVSKITNLRQQRSESPEFITDDSYIFKLDEHSKNTYTYGSNVEYPDIQDNFEIHQTLTDLRYNTILEVPQSTEYQRYEDGDIYGEVMFAKNAFDNTYSMNMPNDYELSNVREYCGIDTCGNSIYLKYYDNITYTGNPTTTTNISSISPTSQSAINYPYQKIEMLGYINKFRQNSSHKSNMFSVQVNGLSLSSNVENKPIVDKLKITIKNTIKQIVKDTCPVNTELFNVYFS